MPSPALLEQLALQLAVIAAVAAFAWGLRLATCALTDRLFERVEPYLFGATRLTVLRKLVPVAYAWLLLLIVEGAAPWFGVRLPVLGSAATLAALWIVLRGTTLLLRDAALARLVAIVAWIVAALDITGLLGPTAAALDSASMSIGSVRLSLLLLVKGVFLIAILLWAALALARLIGARIDQLSGLSSSVQALSRHLIKIGLVFVALLVGLNAIGIDLTAFTVLSGAIGVGLGFGLQKIVSNFVSGIILLTERSIKPGDVIEVGHTYGTVTALGARYASVRGRDGKEYLIPNETLITNQVINWSYSSPLLRLDVAFGVGYASDLHEVRRLAIEAARQTKRVVAAPAPACHITEFGDNAVNLLLRFWIEDPANGVTNVKGDVFLALWDAFRDRGIELPYPQRELRIRELPPDFVTAARVRSAAD